MRVPNLVSSSAEVNPQFHGFNRVFVPYCSGDIWVGTQTAPTSGLTFAGAHIVEAVRSKQLNQSKGASIRSCMMLDSCQLK